MSDFRTRDTAPGERVEAGAYQALTANPPQTRGARLATPAGEETGRMEELLRTLCDLPGPTGQEEAVTGWVARQWEGRGEVTLTPVGNLFLHIPGPGPRVLLAAHADELSLIVRSVTADGFLRVLPGERDVFSFPYFIGQRFRILADGGEVPGILATTTGHALTPEQRDRTRLSWDDLFIDLGMTAEEAAEAGIGVGTRMVWDPGISKVGRLLVGKAMDDRLGVAVLVELSRRLAERKPRFDVTLALTVQEEIGMVGASSLARDGRTFDVGFIIDNGLAGDIPTVAEAHMPVRLGGGPALVHRDSSVHYSRRLIAELRAVAQEHDIPVQDVVLYHYSSDGAHLVRQGMETLLVAPPIRYSHSPFEAVDPRDVESTVRLFEAYLAESAPE
ncbi:MAG TPA: M20/M25/M40 family metallo-hydrolase [Longimicrobium sp.]|jgi:endoglucanase|uniref:M42 family metallopeptidase n=1 Tax=Longimicrobium sp. TaxID=2029185 RepID=UPI002ED980CD